MNTVDDVALVELQFHGTPESGLMVMEQFAEVPFDIKRIFTVHEQQGDKRGRHAHRALTQFMVCVSGACTLICRDGKEERIIELDRMSLGVNVPPGIWGEQIYQKPGSVLLVVCDAPYDAADYIDDWAAFMNFRNGDDLL